MNKHRLVLVVATLVCSALLATTGPPPIVRAPVALTMLFFLPGAALLDAFALDHVLGWLEETVLTLGLSCAAVILLSVGLGLGGQLRPSVFDPALTAFTLGGFAVAALLSLFGKRRPRGDPALARAARRAALGGVTVGDNPALAHADGAVPGDDEATAGNDAAAPSRSVRGRRLLLPSWLDVVFAVAGIGLMAGAAGVALVRPPAQEIDQLWTLPNQGGAIIGIGNGRQAAQYRLTIGPAGVAPVAVDVSLAPNEQWERLFEYPSGWPTDRPVTVTIYRAGETTPYRVAVLAAGSPAP